MNWAPVALLLLIVGFITGSMTIIFAFWDLAINTFDVWDMGQNLVVLMSGFVSIVTLSSSYVLTHKKL